MWECLFDKHFTLTVEHGIQQLVFRAQLDLALKLMKPICLHIREADDDALRILEEVCRTRSILQSPVSLLYHKVLEK